MKRQETRIWTAGPERGKLLSPRRREMEKRKRMEMERSMCWMTSHTVALMQWFCQSLSRRKRGEYAARRELFSGIWKLDAVGEVKNEGWSQGTFREDRRLHEVSGMLDLPAVQRHWNVSLIDYSPSPFFSSANLNHRKVWLSKLVNW